MGCLILAHECKKLQGRNLDDLDLDLDLEIAVSRFKPYGDEAGCRALMQLVSYFLASEEMTADITLTLTLTPNP